MCETVSGYGSCGHLRDRRIGKACETYYAQGICDKPREVRRVHYFGPCNECVALYNDVNGQGANAGVAAAAIAGAGAGAGAGIGTGVGTGIGTGISTGIGPSIGWGTMRPMNWGWFWRVKTGTAENGSKRCVGQGCGGAGGSGHSTVVETGVIHGVPVDEEVRFKDVDWENGGKAEE